MMHIEHAHGYVIVLCISLPGRCSQENSPDESSGQMFTWLESLPNIWQIGPLAWQIWLHIY